MTREELLDNMLMNMMLAARNAIAQPKNPGARRQLAEVVDSVDAWRRADRAQAAAAALPLAVTPSALLAREAPVPVEAAPASPVYEAERTGRAGYKDAD